MSILIKGMEMPTDDSIRIILYPNGQAVKANAVEYEEFEAIPAPQQCGYNFCPYCGADMKEES